MRHFISAVAVGVLASAVCAGDYEYTMDFESVKPGKVALETYLVNGEGSKDEHVGVWGDKTADAAAYAEVADGAGYNNTRGLRVVDNSPGKMLYVLLTTTEGSQFNGAPIVKGVVRFDLCFDKLPTQTVFVGRRNFGININAEGKGISVGGLDAPEGRKVESVKADFTFEAGKWYRIWIQFDSPVGPEEKKLGKFSVFIKPADGKDDFKPEQAVVVNADFKYDPANDGWGRIGVPEGYAADATVVFRVDNFALWSGPAKWAPVTKK